MVDFAGAIPMYVPSKNVFIDRSGYTGKLWLVIHKTASPGQVTAQAIAEFFQTDPSMKSSHYIVGQDGTVVQCVAEKDGAGANCCLEPGHDPFWPTAINLNLCTISIEHVDPTDDNSTPLTEAQKQASFSLVADICKRNSISADDIAGHRSIDPVNRARCPGNYPMDELRAYVQSMEEKTMPIDLNNPVVAGFFSATPDGKWQCKQTGNILQFGMLNFYRSHGKDAFCGLTYLGLPKSNEIPIAGHPGVVKQEFERGWLVYDPKHEVDNPPGSGEIYLMHLPN